MQKTVLLRYRFPVRKYFFTIFLRTSGASTGEIMVGVMKNGSKEWHMYERTAKAGGIFNSSWMFNLEQGDKVNLQLYYGMLYSDSANHLIFTGQLLKSA